MANPRKIIIDTDPGQDDAVALLVALASPELDIAGITAVAGNVPLELTSKNARIICELAGRTDVPVFAGCSRPLERKLVTAEHVHGKTGLDGPDLPDPKMSLQEQHAVDFIVETLSKEPESTVTLCVLGPLTNVATALRREPGIADRIQEIVLMGGAYFEVGNITPTAEFNIYVDPEAAAASFQGGHRDHGFSSGRHPQGVDDPCTHQSISKDRQPSGQRRGGDDRIRRTVRPQKVRNRRRPAPRPLRHFLLAQARIVFGPIRECGD